MSRLFPIALLLFILLLTKVDRLFLKRNHGFCLRTIISTLTYRPEWEPSTPLQHKTLDPIWDQPFCYLAKGHQSFAFLSADGRYVLKFYRFPSHLRPLPWLNHPCAGKARKRVEAYNLNKLDATFASYKLAYDELREETGLLYLHLNKTETLQRCVTLVDRCGAAYRVSLDDMHFLLQKKAEPFFPLLQRTLEAGDEETFKNLISSLFSLISSRLDKGISDGDAILEKNYGWLNQRAVHIDVGRFSKSASKQELRTTTESLRAWMEEHCPHLLPIYSDALPAC
jgi:hypothetical protein